MIGDEVTCKSPDGTSNCERSFKFSMPRSGRISSGPSDFHLTVGRGVLNLTRPPVHGAFVADSGLEWHPSAGDLHALEVGARVKSISKVVGAPRALVITGSNLDAVTTMLWVHTDGEGKVSCNISSVSADGQTLRCDIAASGPTVTDTSVEMSLQKIRDLHRHGPRLTPPSVTQPGIPYR